ncbi:MAG: sodium ion-translocating decarboxylase subunit beta, partial [Lentisphaeria bacterium]
MKRILIFIALIFTTICVANVGEVKKDIWEKRVQASGNVEFIYSGEAPAVVYGVHINAGEILFPKAQILDLKFESVEGVANRSAAHFRIGGTTTVVAVNPEMKESNTILPGAVMFVVTEDVILVHDSSVQGQEKQMGGMGELVKNLWTRTGLYSIINMNGFTLGLGKLTMIVVGMILLWLAVVKGFEPLLLIPIGFGAILANVPLAGIAGPNGFLGMIYSVGVETGLFPLFIFMGVGAMTDFGPLIANPKTALLGAS